MRKWISYVVLAVGVFTPAGTQAADVVPPEPATSEQFAVGQVWRYHTRPGEEGSLAAIGAIEVSPYFGIIVHVKLVGVRIRDPGAPAGFSTAIVHAPVAEAALQASVIALADETVDLGDMWESYEVWLAAHLRKEAGVFAVELSEIVSGTEQRLNHGNGFIRED